MEQQVLCTGCEEPLRQGALSCPKCGTPAPPDDVKKVGPIISLFGALFVVVGPFLSWLTYEATDVSGVEETHKKALIFVGLGVFGAMFSIAAMTGKKFTGLRGNISAGIVSLALIIYFYVELDYLIGEAGASPQFGSGIYFCIAGSVLLLFGGVLTRSPKGPKLPKA